MKASGEENIESGVKRHEMAIVAIMKAQKSSVMRNESMAQAAWRKANGSVSASMAAK
jgi:hypothetical protein